MPHRVLKRYYKRYVVVLKGNKALVFQELCYTTRFFTATIQRMPIAVSRYLLADFIEKNVLCLSMQPGGLLRLSTPSQLVGLF